MQRVRLNKPNGHQSNGEARPRYKFNGRPKGVRNKTTRILKDAVLFAAESVGKNGYGEKGLQGYLERVAMEEPKAFCVLLGKLLPLQLQTNNGEMPKLILADMTPHEAAALYADTLRTLSLDLHEARPMKLLEGKATEVVDAKA